LQRVGLGYVVRWTSEGVAVRFDEVRHGRDGWHAEVAVTDALGPAGQLVWGTEKLDSSRSREQLAKSLTAQTGERVAWSDVLQRSYMAVVATVRSGAPAEAITPETAAGMPMGQAHLLEPLVVAGRDNASGIHGAGGAGKSYLALAGGLAVSTGSAVIPGLVAHLQGPVLYVDFETNRETFARRVRRIAQGAELPRDAVLHYRRCRLPLLEDVAAIAEEADRLGAVLVIVDSVERAMGGASGDYAGPEARTMRLYEGLDLIPAAKWLIDHVAKVEVINGSPSLAYGSVFKTNAARTAWEVRRSEEQSEGSNVYLGLRHAKANDEPRHAPIGLRVEHLPDRTIFHAADLTEMPEMATSLRAPERILALLDQGGSYTPKEIGRRLELKPGTVRSALLRMERQGQIVDLGDARYVALPEPTEQIH
jgi:hypothetical protein